MGKKPVYGATVADTMINLLMNNPAVRQLVDEEARSLRKSPISVFCLKNGPGQPKVDPLTFAREQQRYLTDTPKRARLCRLPDKSKPPVTFGPWRNLGEARRAMGM
jgi:hypothetical protein